MTVMHRGETVHAQTVGESAMAQLHTTTFSSRVLGSLLALLVSALLTAGCGSGPTSQTQPLASATSPPTKAEVDHINRINSALAAAALQTPFAPADYRLAPEDLLEITLYNILESDAAITPRRVEVRVSQEGMISLPLLGDVRAAGQTLPALEQALRARYDRYFHNPHVGVQIREFRGQRVTVTGAVRNPGVLQLTGPKTLVDVLSLAGGLSEQAGSQVHLYRQGPEGRQSYVIDLPALARNPGLVDMPVQAGDVINVPQSGTVFVYGAVGRQGSYPLAQPYTFTQALTIAGGVNGNLADYSGIAIYRRQDGLEAEKIPVNLDDIFAGKARDPLMAPDDMIVVPISSFKWFVQRFIGGIGLPSIPAPY
jgi:polysaccharide export outer membrane protein